VEGADFLGMGRISDTSSDRSLTRFGGHGFAIGIKCPYLRDVQQPRLHSIRRPYDNTLPSPHVLPDRLPFYGMCKICSVMAQQPNPDRALIAQFQQGDQRAFETLFARHRDQVYTKLYLLVRDHDVAADLFQDVFIKVVDVLRSGKYNEEGKFLPWVLRIAHNAGIDHFRRQKKMPLSRGTEEYDLLGGLQDDMPTREEELISGRILEDVRSLVDQLPEEQKEVVQMRMYREMSFKDIADSTGVSINTALGRMRYALINLRKMMEEQKVSLTLD